MTDLQNLLAIVFILILITYYFTVFVEMMTDNSKYMPWGSTRPHFNGKREFYLDLLIPFRYWITPIIERLRELHE